ncbi:hypothetical protein ACFSR7_25360 [Cohnella sp. GCM10020058]|uniref:hypothetical protein n=1 Tax=Cohnella sp. GCM10020058 TaxID=3317330 RepID=UPI0036374ADE
MSEYIGTITFHQAREAVEVVALRKLSEFMDSSNIPVLRDPYKESEYCWIFFRNKQIQGPPERELTWGWAYAISKKGEIRLIGDLSDEPEKLEVQIGRLSNYFKEKGL